MTIKTQPMASLNALEINFLARQWDEQLESIAPPEELLCALASSDEARIRLALIPLLLRHPHYAKYVQGALQRLTPTQQHVLRCYYTAAQLLQEKHKSQLTELFGTHTLLPLLFEDYLGLDNTSSPEKRLHQLGRRQAQLSGKPINWYGTYKHAYQRLIHHAKWRNQWQ